MTIRHGEQITSIGLATCGKGGTRLAARLGMQTTRQTILRRIMDLPDSSTGVILFLGIDDFSFRRRSRFGTILINLESRRVVDLLPDREAETSAAWMRQQLDLMVVSRDRGGVYASCKWKENIAAFGRNTCRILPILSEKEDLPTAIRKKYLP
jgi:Transposase